MSGGGGLWLRRTSWLRCLAVKVRLVGQSELAGVSISAQQRFRSCQRLNLGADTTLAVRGHLCPVGVCSKVSARLYSALTCIG